MTQNTKGFLTIRVNALICSNRIKLVFQNVKLATCKIRKSLITKTNIHLHVFPQSTFHLFGKTPGYDQDAFSLTRLFE